MNPPVQNDFPLFDWEELLLLIEDQVVIPVVGKELLHVQKDGKDVLLELYLAEHLAEELSLSREALSEKPNLDEVVTLYLSDAGEKTKTRKRIVQKKIETFMTDNHFPVPEPLKKLAEISHFHLFVSTTFDSFLFQALNEVRFDGEEQTHQLAYYCQSQKHDDLPVTYASKGEPYVYRIFGSLASSIDFAVTIASRKKWPTSSRTGYRTRSAPVL